MFAFIGGIMSLVDTVTGNLLHYFLPNYSSLFGVIYGYGDIPPELAVAVSSLYADLQPVLSGCPCGTQAGKDFVPLPGRGSCRRYPGWQSHCSGMFCPQSLVDDISELATRAMGFMGGGTVNYLFPLLTLFLLTAVFSLGGLQDHPADGSEIKDNFGFV